MTTVVRGSVRKKLLVALLVGFSLTWLTAGALSLIQAHAELDHLLDINLRQSAMPLLHEIDEAKPQHALSLFRYSSNVVFQIWKEDETLVLHSRSAPSAHLSSRLTGFSDSVIDGQRWRVFGVWDDSHQYLVQVAQRSGERQLFAGRVLRQILQSLLLAVPLFAVMIWFGIGRALRPVMQLRDEIARRDPRFLMPIRTPVPLEIAPLVERLNELLQRIQGSIDSERRFTGDAAHELRTPLAALKSQLQVAQAASDAAQRDNALSNALLACDQATHRVGQMLTLARLDHDVWQRPASTIDLYALAAQTIADMAAMAADKKIQLSLDGDTDAELYVHGGLLGVLLRNLLDNAIRYAPEDTRVCVRVRALTDAVELEVCDEGEGIPEAERVAALQRFNRLGRDQRQSGSGLGLSIVARIAELHHAQLTLTDGENARGLCVRVRVPRAAADIQHAPAADH